MGRWRAFALVLAGLAAFFAALAVEYFRRYALPPRCELALYGCLLLLATAALIPATTPGREAAAAWSRGRFAFALPACACLLPYAVYALGCGDPRWTGLARASGVTLPPLLVYRAAPVARPERLAWQDGFAWTWLALAVVLRQIHGIWTTPAELDFMARLLVIAVASWCWVVVRPVPGVGYDLSTGMRTVRAAAVNLAGFAAIALPLALLTHFAAWTPRWHGVWAFCATLAEIFIFIAWLEELLYRGVLQTLLSRTLGRVWGQLAASVLFGFSHILLGAAPNWRYVAIASVAGWFYGSAFRAGGNLMAPAIMHALVDTAWRTWFGGRG